MRVRALAKLLLAFTAAPADAQILRGRVVDDDTERGLEAVSLALIDAAGETPLSTLTDEQGRFRLVPRGGARFALRVERPGYSGFIAEDVVVARGEEVALEVRLAADRIVLSPITVVGRRRIGDVGDFRSRLRLMRAAGIGQSLVRSEIAAREVLEITDLLATLPDIVIAGPARARTVRFATATGAGTCAPSLFVNARPVEPAALDLVGTPAVIDAVELYSGAVESPAEFEDPAGCGVVLVWTRPDPADAPPVKWRRAVVYIGMTVVGVVLFSR